MLVLRAMPKQIINNKTYQKILNRNPHLSLILKRLHLARIAILIIRI